VPLGDAQIKNLTDRLNRLAAGVASGFTAEVYTNAISVQPSQGQIAISQPAGLPAGSPPGTEICIECHGNGTWPAAGTGGAQNGVSWYCYLGQPTGATTCEAKINGNGGMPAGPFSWHATVTCTVTGGGLAIMHTSAQVAPTPSASAWSINAEQANSAYSIPSPNLGNAFVMFGAWENAALSGGGALLTTHRTKITYYGGV
jgi:hypothetical protein